MGERKVYLVTSGEYSDYGVSAVFSTRKLAEGWIAAHEQRYDRYRIEDYDLNPDADRIRSGCWAYRIMADIAGDVRHLAVTDDAPDPDAFVLSDPPRYVVRFRDDPPTDDRTVRFVVEASDPDHARKIAGERIARWKADGRWPERVMTPEEAVARAQARAVAAAAGVGLG